MKALCLIDGQPLLWLLSIFLLFIGGLLLLLGVLLLPADLPFNRVLFASLAACLDLSLLVIIAMLIFLPFRKRRS